MVASGFENLQVASCGRWMSRGAAASAGETRFASAECGISHPHNSRDCHTIHVHAPSRLASASVGVGVGVGVLVGVGGVGVWSSGVVNVGDNACMVGLCTMQFNLSLHVFIHEFRASPCIMVIHVLG